jgi:hypothetical protein
MISATAAYETPIMRKLKTSVMPNNRRKLPSLLAVVKLAKAHIVQIKVVLTGELGMTRSVLGPPSFGVALKYVLPRLSLTGKPATDLGPTKPR